MAVRGRRLQKRPKQEASLLMTASVGLQPRRMPERPPTAPLVEVTKLTKTFPGVLAVDQVDLTIAPGEIVALLGPNGAGKSTLIQILSGVHPAGSWTGEIRMNGQIFRPTSVADAERGGVAFLAQEVGVAPGLTVAENMTLNNEPSRWGFIDRPRQLAETRAALSAFDLDIDPTLEMGRLDLATQQLVLIVRALSKNAQLLILDEPTAALTEREAERLFNRMRALKALGVAIIFVSHRLAEVFAISDRIVVMRDGRIGGVFTTSETSRDAVVAEMVGSRLSRTTPEERANAGKVALATRDFNVFAVEGGRPLAVNIDLDLHQGEILGLFGLLGSGALEIAMALFGAWPGKTSGEIRLNGARFSPTDPSRAVAAGIGLIAQDRRDGLSSEHSIYDNTILAHLGALSNRFGFIDAMAARRLVQDLFDRLHIKAQSLDTIVGTLSGGNQQKVQVARWLAAGVKVLLLVDPTRGVDVGARAEIHRIWRELALSGSAILLVSSDAEELVDACDRVAVVRSGRIADTVGRADISEERLLRVAAGI
ncbi:MAG: sugar ABC transporter ATP-binding protein [Bradyrhizobium sp.]|nr:MAG: sugar ABC transporter ATP-binding protein [Bradyrhizobium sp.]